MIEVVEPGLYTTVQDGGRHGWLRYGVSRGGAMDGTSLRLANLLVGNAPEEGTLEFTLLPPALRFDAPALVAVTGARCAFWLAGPQGERPFPMDEAVFAKPGETLRGTAAQNGARGHVAVSGGFGLEKQLGSVSADEKAAIGGLGAGARLKKGDRLFTVLPPFAGVMEHARLPRPYRDGAYLPRGAACLRVVEGPQGEALSQEGRGKLFSQEFEIAPQSDRMGLRLTGEPLAHAPGRDGNIITDALLPGAVQVLPNGLPILMLAGAQTTGGYAKPCCVIGADLPLAGQLRPGDRVRFCPVSVGEGEKAWREYCGGLAAVGAAFRPVKRFVVVQGTYYEIYVREVLPT